MGIFAVNLNSTYLRNEDDKTNFYALELLRTPPRINVKGYLQNIICKTLSIVI
jgi:hypothetical protein